LKERRDMMRSLLWSGDGRDIEVPGIGREGMRNGGGVCGNEGGWRKVVGEFPTSWRDGRTLCERGPSQWIPGRSRIWSVCSTITFLWPSLIYELWDTAGNKETAHQSSRSQRHRIYRSIRGVLERADHRAWSPTTVVGTACKELLTAGGCWPCSFSSKDYECRWSPSASSQWQTDSRICKDLFRSGSVWCL